MTNTYVINETASRPWGCWSVIAVGPNFAVKQIVVHPGDKISLQRHRWRDEHWVVVEGVADIELNGAIQSLAANSAVFIAAGQTHRVANRGTQNLVIIEVQYGAQLEETDIERLTDDYGRA